jgi:pyrroloquinoline quinone biosynthesis protein D
MQEAAGSHILLNPASGQCFALDEIGALIWSLCDGAHSVADIVAAIVSEYDAPVETVLADTLELLQELGREKLLREDH